MLRNIEDISNCINWYLVFDWHDVQRFVNKLKGGYSWRIVPRIHHIPIAACNSSRRVYEWLSDPIHVQACIWCKRTRTETTHGNCWLHTESAQTGYWHTVRCDQCVNLVTYLWNDSYLFVASLHWTFQWIWYIPLCVCKMSQRGLLLSSL